MSMFQRFKACLIGVHDGRDNRNLHDCQLFFIYPTIGGATKKISQILNVIIFAFSIFYVNLKNSEVYFQY